MNVSNLFVNSNHCYVYHLAKEWRLPFISLNNFFATPFQLIHCDIWGPFHVPIIEGYRYFFTIVDDCIRFTWIYLLHTKSKMITIFPTTFSLIQNQVGVKIKFIRFDNVLELSLFDFSIKKESCLFILVWIGHNTIQLSSKSTNTF